jgi:transcriptional antiterminator NusG
MSKWYTLKIVSNTERKTFEKLNVNKDTLGMEDIFLPIEKYFVIDKKTNKRIQKEKPIIPGYLLIKIGDGMMGEVKQNLKGIKNVLNILPTPLRDSEVKMYIEEYNAEEKLFDFAIGMDVEIIDGPFNSFKGKIQSLNKDKQRMVVDVKIFGRSTTVDLSFSQVKIQQ